jgi:hypothetical protein
MRDEWLNFMPVFIIFFFVCYPYEFVQISETSLGKLFAVFLILYYSSVDLVYGICVCAIIVFYYHLEVSTSIWSIERSQRMQESMEIMMEDLDNDANSCGCDRESDSSSCNCDSNGDKDSASGFCSKCSRNNGKRITDLNVESFQSGDAAPFKYDPLDPSLGRSYNESVLSGVSRKKELESSMAQSREPMYSSIEPNAGSMRLVSDNSLIQDTEKDTRCVFSRIFEPIR